MAKAKADLLKEANEKGLKLTDNNTVAEIQATLANEDSTKPEEKDESKPLAKAGKRSAKAIAQKEAELAKEARKSEPATKPEAKKTIKPTRPKLERRGKGYRKSSELVDRKQDYNLKDALELAIRTSHVKFDATVEVHVRLNVDPKQADQNIRDSVILPAGTGKSVRVNVFAEEDVAKQATSAGADFAGNEELLAKLEKGNIDFEVLIATPNLMAKLAKYARILGPKGLMPNPKSGTVTNNVEKAVKQAKAGKIEYRVDSTGIVHVGIGKVSFGASKLEDNAKAFFESLKSNKPTSIKGTYVSSIFVGTSMGPSIPLAISEL